MTHEPNTEHVLALAAIICEVGTADQRLGAGALAKAILSHPASQRGPVLTVPTDAELEASFVAWYQDTYGEPPLGIPPSSDVIKLARHLLQRWSPQPTAPWPELPLPTDVELEADFRAWFEAKHECEYFGGISLSDAIAWGKHLLQHSPQPAAPWPQLPREAPAEVLNLATFNACSREDAAKLAWQCCRAEIDRQRIGQGLSVPEPASWPELPPQPPGPPSRGENPYWTDGLVTGWAVARVELQRQREQARAAPTPAPAFPEISDQLIKMLIGDVLAVADTVTEQSCLDRCWNPVPEVRARLTEILRLAAQDEAKRPAL